jgi:predicted nucleotide-binding protein (sugar kinase/HSP70/actin superfamily)
MKIGIPRALGYYTYYPFWHGFFTDLGIDIVLSGRTTKRIISQGSALVVSETCLPVKAYAGHVIDLLNKGVDVIYCPSIQSIAPKIYNCSKLRGLPDLIRNVVKRNFLLVEPTLDKSVPNQGLYEYLYESVAPLGITDKKRIKKASKAGWECMDNYWLMTRAGMSHDQAMKNAIAGKIVIEKDSDNSPISVAVLSHGYNLYDEHISMKVFNKLKKLDVKPYTAENLTREQMTEGVGVLNTNLYWANENEITGAAGHFLKDNSIDGIITMTAFGCGPDSLMIERITRYAKKYRKPLLNLTVDEHTGEAGFITRLEAFTDMLLRRKRADLVASLNRQIAESSNDGETVKIHEEFESMKIRI